MMIIEVEKTLVDRQLIQLVWVQVHQRINSLKQNQKIKRIKRNKNNKIKKGKH